MEILTNTSTPSLYPDDTKRTLGPVAIVTITVFVIIAIVIFAGAIYLLVQGKNLSEYFEDPSLADDKSDCFSLGFSENSQHSEGSTDDNVSVLFLCI